MDSSLNGSFDQGHTGTCSFLIQLKQPCRRDRQPNAMIVIAEIARGEKLTERNEKDIISYIVAVGLASQEQMNRLVNMILTCYN